MAKTDQKQFQATWFRAWRDNGDENARDLLIDSCIGLVRRRATSLLWCGLTFRELEAEGVAALYDALGSYEPTKGPFSAHAYNQIIDPMMRLAQSVGNPYSVPSSRPEKRLAYKLKKTIAKHENAGYPSGAAFDLACDELQVPQERAATSLATRSPVRLSVQPSGEDDERGVQIAAADRPSEAAIDKDQGRTQRILIEAFAGLDDRERDILTRRLTPARPPSLDTLAAEYGISRERVGQLQREAMRHVRLEFERRGLELSDLL